MTYIQFKKITPPHSHPHPSRLMFLAGPRYIFFVQGVLRLLNLSQCNPLPPPQPHKFLYAMLLDLCQIISNTQRNVTSFTHYCNFLWFVSLLKSVLTFHQKVLSIVRIHFKLLSILWKMKPIPHKLCKFYFFSFFSNFFFFFIFFSLVRENSKLKWIPWICQ